MHESLLGIILLGRDFRPARISSSVRKLLQSRRGAAELPDEVLKWLKNGAFHSSLIVRLGSEDHRFTALQLSSLEGGEPDIAVIVEPWGDRIPDLELIGAKYRLTLREREVLRLVLDGQSNKEIGGKLSISSSTVKAFVRTLITKFGVEGRAELISKLLRQKH